MSVQRNKRRRFAWISLATAFAVLPNQMGFQDLGALIARQPAVSQRWRAYLVASPPGISQAAMFSLPRPLGTAIPRPPLYALASVNPNEVDGALGREVLGDTSTALQFPSVNRKHKGDALVMRPRQPMPLRRPSPDELVPQVQTEASFTEIIGAATDASDVPERPNPGGRDSRIFFGAGLLGAPREKIMPWLPGAAPQIVDLDVKLAALTPERNARTERPGESIAAKGEVTGIGKRPISPAERLKLGGASRVKAEKCLANAIYFEARDEPVRAQVGVAQVVLNRAFSPYYPNNVCDVIYQNAHRRLACQFTFACDGKRDVVTEPDSWSRAKRIAADMLDGKLWMPEVAKSTHYHDDWAHPSWVREMRRLDKQGGLIFYRPRNWGDGAEEPKWGDAKTTAKTVAKL